MPKDASLQLCEVSRDRAAYGRRNKAERKVDRPSAWPQPTLIIALRQ